jgi:DNA-binding CsgD family transcriptional regulator
VDDNGRVPQRGTPPRFVGRADELELLSSLLARTRTGSPTTALVYGEAGVGKTRLVNELVHRARVDGVRTLVGGCVAVGGRSLAFAPFAEALRPLATELAVGARADGGDVGNPLLASFVSRLSGGNGHGIERAGPASSLRVGAMTQTQLFEEVVDGLERIATPDGALLVIEDLHWADPSSRGLFDFVARNKRGAPIALVGTARSDEPPDPELSGWLAELQRGVGAVRIDLEPFTRPELIALIDAVLDKRVPDQAVDRIYVRSGGNAFLAQELLAMDEGGGGVPPTVRDLLLARTTRLGPEARKLFALAAVAGLEVGHDLLASASGLSGNEFEWAVRELVEHQLLVVTESRSGYMFRHALTREAVYGDLLPGERRRLHGLLAGALAGRVRTASPAGVAVAAIAEHWDAADETERALRAHVDAGRGAERVFAYADALRHYERALELWDRVGDPATATATDRPALLAGAAEVASANGQDDRGIGHANAAIAELEESRATPARIGELYHRLGWYLTRAGRDHESQEAMRRAKALIPPEPPTAARAQILAIVAGDLMVMGRYTEAIDGARAALETARRAGARRQEAAARNVIGSALVGARKDIDRGIAELRRAIAIGREVGDAEEVVVGAINLSDCLIQIGRYDEAATVALDGAEHGRRSGAARAEVGYVMLNAAEALIPAGRWDEAEAIAKRALQLHAGVQVDLMASASSAIIHAYSGQLDQASTELARAVDLGHDVTQPQAIAMVETGRALVALVRGDLSTARQAIGHALDVFDATEDMGRLVALVAIALRIEADRATVGRGRRDTESASAAIAAARNLAERARTAAPESPTPLAAAELDLCEAELGRAEGQSEPERWLEASDAFVATGRPYAAEYARFREAEAVLARGGDRARAVAALNAAYARATELGALPLGSEVEALARRARITLTELVTAEPAPSPADATVTSSEPQPPLGLTAREVDVLRLLAAGQTNPQIAEALYISRKTASHHVSNILRKLGVSTRVEAAGVAHRLGLDR